MIRTVASSGKRIGYGWLYNAFAIQSNNGLAPDGWEIASYGEDNIFGIYAADMRSQNQEWKPATYINTNITKLNVLPTGVRIKNDYGTYEFKHIRERTHIAGRGTVGPPTELITASIHFDAEYQYIQQYMLMTDGVSVRCRQSKSANESNGDMGTLQDVDGNVYNYIVNGSYRYMMENLRTTKYKNGISIPEVTNNTTWGGLTTGARCAYNNDHYFVYPPGK